MAAGVRTRCGDSPELQAPKQQSTTIRAPNMRSRREDAHRAKAQSEEHHAHLDTHDLALGQEINVSMHDGMLSQQQSPQQHRPQWSSGESSYTLNILDVSSPKEGTMEDPSSNADASDVEFVWNGRTCAGKQIHTLALSGDVDAAKTLLDRDPDAISLRFRYETVFQGKVQEGSGEPIHLAASRGHLEMLQVLVRRGANLEATVTRDHQAHYNVMHAAVFAEGMGGKPEVVQYLIEAKVPLTPNLDRRWPLHLAFQTGALALIPMIRQEMAKESLLEDALNEQGVPLPLELGIKTGRMSEEELAIAAQMSPLSLQVFMKMEPRCVPAFLKRVVQSKALPGALLADYVTTDELANLLRVSSLAGSAVLDCVTTVPAVEHPGWNPLPTRVSFAPRNSWEKLRRFANSEEQFSVFYRPEQSWQYNAREFRAPKWQMHLKDRSAGRPILDVDIRVCHMPNIICAEFFAALLSCTDQCQGSIFENDVVRGATDFAWWHGAWSVDLLSGVLSIWCLVLLVFETYLLTEEATREMQAAVAFIVARSCVDIFLEAAQAIGFFRMGRGCDYFDAENAFDLLRSGVPILLLKVDSNRYSWGLILVVFLTWGRLLGVFTSAERIARVLLPITRLVWDLIPALVVTCIGFLAFAHAFTAVSESEPVWPDIIYKTFSLLFSASLPSDPSENFLELVLSYLSVVCFAVFFLNVFIGVINESYMVEREQSQRTFMRQRAGDCLAYLIRIRVLPCMLISKRCAAILSMLAACLALSLQVFMMVSRTPPSFLLSTCSFGFLQLVMTLAAYQRPDSPLVQQGAQGRWTSPSNKQPRREDTVTQRIVRSDTVWSWRRNMMRSVSGGFVSDRNFCGKHCFLWLVTARETLVADSADQIALPETWASSVREVVREELATALAEDKALAKNSSVDAIRRRVTL